MTKSIALSLVLAASLGLAACSGNHEENAANAAANSAENASNAADNAMNAAMNAADNAAMIAAAVGNPKAAGEVFHAVVDGKFTIVDVVIPEGWYAGSDNDAFGRQGIFPAGACGELVDCHAEAFEDEEDLIRKIDNFYDRLDVDGSGA